MIVQWTSPGTSGVTGAVDLLRAIPFTVVNVVSVRLSTGVDTKTLDGFLMATQSQKGIK